MVNGHEFVLIKSMEKWLAQACYRLNIPSPVYHYEELTLHMHNLYMRFVVTLANNSIGQKLIAFGKYAEDHYVAQEDATCAMLGELLTSTGMRIRDYNYQFVSSLEERLYKMENEFSLVAMENASLKEQIGRMKGRTHYRHG